MSVQEAVERREAAPAQITPQQAVKAQLDQYRPVIAKLLTGTGITEETFVAQIANACRVNPALWRCDPASLLGAALRAAQLGLAPNDVRNLCWIIPYGNVAQFQLGYGGVLELARRAMPGLKFDGRAVYPNDEFDVDYGKPEPLTHRPAVVRGLDRGGDAFAWYVRAVYPDGTVQIQILDREGVEYHRTFSKQPNGEMWSKSYDAAALKSVVLDMKRWLPSSAQLAAAFDSDERVIHVDEVEPITDAAPPRPQIEAGSASPTPSGEGEAADAEPTAGRSKAAPPASPPVHTDKDIGIAAGRAFPCNDAPRGQKTKLQERLRYALTYCVTGGKAWHLSDLDDRQRAQLRIRLAEVEAGRLPYNVDDDGVTFLEQKNDGSVNEIVIRWDQITEPDPAS